MEPGVVDVFVCTARIAKFRAASSKGWVLQSGGRIFEDCASSTLVEPLLTKVNRVAVRFPGRQTGLPAQTVVHCQPGVRLPGILQVHAKIVLAAVADIFIARSKFRSLSDHEVGQANARDGLSAECEGGIAALAIIGVQI